MRITDGQLVQRGKYWHWRYRVDGRQQSRSLKVTSKAEAVRLRQEYIAEFNANPANYARKAENPTVDEFWGAYVPWAVDHKRPNTVKADRTAWETLLRFTDAQRVGDIKPRSIEQLKAKMLNEGLKGEPVKHATVNRVLRHLKSIFNRGIKLGFYTGPNPLKEVELYRVTKTVPDFLAQAEVERLLEAAQQHSRELHLVTALAFYLGLRKNEVVNCRWEWFNFERRVAKVTKSDTFNIKDHEERTIPIGDRIIEILEPYREVTGYVFEERKRAGRQGRYRFDPHRELRDVAQAAEVPHATLQMLRRSFGSALASDNVSLYKISRWMGYSSVDVTARYYAELQEYDDDISKL